ncbi:DUF1489 family protein [Marinovum sp.]|uniref:DUF1489 family protein n=1 Tax=Marinovum sp. TaxID=2024839 RepID=UPI003A91B98A
MTDHINLIKLCVGTETPDDLARFQTQRRKQLPDTLPRHVTRMWPKRAEELVNGGSLYWVFKGVCLARQRVIRLDEVTGQDGIVRCGIVLDPEIIRTNPMPRRAFQGWRYLTPADAPADLSKRAQSEDPLPASLNAALAEIGVL